MFKGLLICLFVTTVSSKVVQVELYKEPSIQTHVESASADSDVKLAAPTIHLLTNFHNNHYLANFSLGSPSKKFQLAIHTGSTTLWVFDQQIDPINGYVASASKTNNLLKVPEFFDTSGDTVYKGQTYTDLLEINGLTYSNQSFGVIEKVEEDGELLKADGMLGLNWAFDAKDRSKDEMPILNLLPQLDQPLYSLWLERAQKPNQPARGLLTLGGLDSKNCQSNVDYVPATKSGYWQATFQIDSVSIGDYMSGKDEKFTGILDSGSPFIHAENKAHYAFFKQINAAFDESLNMYTVECSKKSSLPEWSFKIGGKEYKIKAEQYLLELGSKEDKCALAIQSYPSEQFGWTLGMPFMQAYCTVFDVGANRFGFSLPQKQQ